MAELTNGIGWFEIGTDDPAGAERFYGDVFGWTFADDTSGVAGYRITTTPAGDSIQGGVFATGGQMPNYAIFCVQVADVAESCRRTESAGGKVLVPVQRTDTGLAFAHLADPAGNHFGVFSAPAGSPAA